MLPFVLIFLILVHGFIHAIGFAKAFGLGKIAALSEPISKPLGILWLFTMAIFVIAASLLLFKKEYWWLAGLIAVVLSQILLFTVWKDARFGSIANVIIFLSIIAAWGNQRFEKVFREDLVTELKDNVRSKTAVLTEKDLQPLPVVIRKYLLYTGVVNKPVVTNVKIVFDGEMREKGKDWFPFRSEQYNFTLEPTRLFFMKAKIFGIKVPIYHAYKEGVASMQVKLFGLYPMVDLKGEELNKAETVTIFNDLCIFVPSFLADKRIQWEDADSLSAKAVFFYHGISISATLQFNEIGQLVNFISDDRYAMPEKKRYRFSTPVGDYKNINGYNLPTYGEAIWHYPEGKFIYGKFYLKEITYNIQ